MASDRITKQTDSPEYLERKAFFDQLITVYGRKPVLEILQDHSLKIFRVHLADSNRSGGIIDQKNSWLRHEISKSASIVEPNCRASRAIANRTRAPPVIFTALAISLTGKH